MFYYISFLRPPPVQAGPYGTVSITPQISNDLRTDALDTPQDLYYAWALHAPLPRSTKAPLVTKAAHVFRRRPGDTAVEPVLTGGMDNPVDVAFTSTGDRLLTATFLEHPQLGKRDLTA